MNSIKPLIFIFYVIILSYACVPVKKQIMLRSDNPVKEVNVDTIVSVYNINNQQYRLRNNDIISIKVSSATPSEFDILNYQSDKTLSGLVVNNPLLTGFNIEEDGTIFLPVIGKVEIAGLTLSEAREKIQTIVSDYLESPTVDIKLLSFQFTVLGEVQKEGIYTSYNPTISLMDALGYAGGLSEFADGTMVKIVRQKEQQLEVAYVDIMDEEIMRSPYFYVRPNDLVTVPPLKAKNFRLNSAANISLIVSGITAVGIFLNWVY